MLIISPRVTSPSWTDFRSIASMLASGRLTGKSGEELAVAIWRLLVDKAEGFYHYCPAVERLTGHFVYEPVKLFNVFGWSICGVTANTLAVLYAAAGFQAARICRLKGHEATEVYYDGAWHLFDGDLQACHRRHPPEEETIASYADCLAAPTLISRRRNPPEPYYLPDRPPRGADTVAGSAARILHYVRPVAEAQAGPHAGGVAAAVGPLSCDRPFVRGAPC